MRRPASAAGYRLNSADPRPHGAGSVTAYGSGSWSPAARSLRSISGVYSCIASTSASQSRTRSSSASGSHDPMSTFAVSTRNTGPSPCSARRTARGTTAASSAAHAAAATAAATQRPVASANPSGSTAATAAYGVNASAHTGTQPRSSPNSRMTAHATDV